jgi:hypothetical protein
VSLTLDGGHIDLLKAIDDTVPSHGFEHAVSVVFAHFSTSGGVGNEFTEGSGQAFRVADGYPQSSRVVDKTP